MPSLAEICNQCKADTEKSIKSYIETLEELRNENEQLKCKIKELSEQPQQSEDVRAFLDAMEPIIANEEKLKGRTHNKHLCELYRAIERGEEVKIQGHILYKIYYSDYVAYLGRTNQPLQNRIRGHLFQKPMHRCININLVTKIEYATFPTEADMNLYEIYFINKLKPMLNVDDKTSDELTVTLPDVEFKVFDCHLWDKWKAEINEKSTEYSKKSDRYRAIQEEYRIIRSQFRLKEINEKEYENSRDSIEKEEAKLRKYLYG